MESEFESMKFSTINSPPSNKYRKITTPNLIHKNYPKRKAVYELMNPETYEFNMKYCKIRPNKSLEEREREKTAWTIEVGIFKDYLREEKQNLIEKCFEFDWANMKKIRFKKSSEEDIKAEMYRMYPLIREQYKIQSGFNPSVNIFSIG